MGAGPESTAHHRETIADLRSKLADIDKKAEKLRRMISELSEFYEDGVSASVATTDSDLPGEAITVQASQPASTAELGIGSLGLGDACVFVIKQLGGRATNQKITARLQELGYKIKSTNPVNNVGTGLHHRSKNRGDVVRVGRDWALKPTKEASPSSDKSSGSATYN